MATISLVETGFSLIPEGWHIFQVADVLYKEAFGKLEVTLKTKTGQSITERFQLFKNGTPNDGAMKAFSFFAKTAMNDFTLTDIDPDVLKGHYIRGHVVHTEQPSTKNEGETVTFANIDKKEPASGFEPEATAPTTPTEEMSLEGLLGV